MNHLKVFKRLVFLVVTSPSFAQLSSNECMEQLSIFAESAKIKNYEAAYEPWKSVLDNCPKLNVATYQFGERILKDFISKNYKNFKVSRSLFSLSKNIDYSKKVYKFILNNNFDLIEVHNRPQIATFLIKKGIKNTSLFFCNDPLSIRGSKLLSDRKFLINNCQNIYFISNWVRKRFFENFVSLSDVRI